MRRSLIVLFLLTILSAAGCATGESSDSSDRAGDVNDRGQNGEGPRSPGEERAGLGEECTRDADCSSELCLVDPAVDMTYCSKFCEEACETEGYVCVEINDGGELRGACLFDEDEPPVDLETECPGVCEPGEEDLREEACGACGEGLRARVRVCNDRCGWGQFSDWSECATDAQCAPADVDEETEACEGGCPGFERVRERTCDADSCRWSAWGEWDGCDELTVCTPSDVERDERPCPTCGMQERTRECGEDGCSYGEWSDWSSCGGMTESDSICEPGEPQTATEACGDCGEGERSRTRTCASDGCSFGEWSDWSDCETNAQCSPGQTQTDTDDCGPCNAQRERTRSCNSTTCRWNDYGSFSSCPSRTCTPGQTRDGGCDGCSHQVCNAQCGWGDCQLRSGNQCNHNAGTNWRCCGGGSWQFCLSSCQWSTACEACTGCGC